MLDWLWDASAWVMPVMLAVILHEVAHGWMAERFGDPTARMMGRLTLNPMKHVDRTGTFIFPAILIMLGSPVVFGYAKPVPVNFRGLNPPRLGMFMVALAGPMTNVLEALVIGLLLHIDNFVTPEQAPWLFLNLYRALALNCSLAVFNMLPMLPLDGGRVVYSLLPGRAKDMFARVERYGMLIVLLILLGPSLVGLTSQDIFGPPVFWLYESVLALTGNGSQ